MPDRSRAESLIATDGVTLELMLTALWRPAR
jgi:hypothetical protein